MSSDHNPSSLNEDEERSERVEEEEEGEDLFDDNAERDYRPDEVLDQYDIEDLDAGDYSDLSMGERRAAERAISAREREEAIRQGIMPEAMMDSEGDDEGRGRRRREKRRRRESAQDEASEGDAPTNLEDLPLGSRQKAQTPEGQKEIRRLFKTFLTSFTEGNNRTLVYEGVIQKMCIANKKSLPVNFTHLSSDTAVLAILVADAPALCLSLFDEVALEVVLQQFPAYQDIHTEIHVRITHLPISDRLRDIRQIHLNALIRVSGVVTRRTGVFPQLKKVQYDCLACGALLGPFLQTQWSEMKIGMCPECQARGPFVVNEEQTIYRNFQKITLQEAPGTVLPGRLPRHKEVVLVEDLIDSVRPGELVDITGIYINNFDESLNRNSGFPVFQTVIEANYIEKKDDDKDAQLTAEEEREIRQLSKDPMVWEKIINSIAPSVYGANNIKTAIALSLFGGVAKNINDKHRLRGDINVLLLGDPGTAKSQFLKFVEKIASRAVFTTGKGASAVGLTAAVHKDPITREWTLEGGALVLADTGVCMIDEFDKMSDADRVSIHEAMEQQSISISKAGIVTTLQARCAIIAAANPLSGKYDSSIPFNKNVALTEPILSRFDILCVVKDMADPVQDERLASFVVDSHMNSHPNRANDDEEAEEDVPEGQISQELLRKYIRYARTKCRPQLSALNQDKIKQLYSDLRQESLHGGISIQVRHMESIIRMAEAMARMHLRDQVLPEDTDFAISFLLRNFFATQKQSVLRDLERKFGKYLSLASDSNELLSVVLHKKLREAISIKRAHDDLMGTPDVQLDDFETAAKELNIFDLAAFYKSKLFTANFQLDKHARLIRVKVK